MHGLLLKPARMLSDAPAYYTLIIIIVIMTWEGNDTCMGMGECELYRPLAKDLYMWCSSTVQLLSTQIWMEESLVLYIVHFGCYQHTQIILIMSERM